MIITGQIRNVTVRQEGQRVLVVENGRAILDLPHDAALALAKALHIKAKQAEELANVEQIVMDQAIVQRAGFPIGLTNNRTIQREAMKEAAWNSDLRRYMPGGIKSQSVVGTPAVIRHEPKGKRP